MTRPVTSVKGIGAAAAATLAKTGIHSAEELASMTVEQLSRVPGFSVASATRVIAEAGKAPAVDRAASARPAAGGKATIAPADRAPQPEPAGKGKSKGKEKGKGKGAPSPEPTTAPTNASIKVPTSAPSTTPTYSQTPDPTLAPSTGKSKGKGKDKGKGKGKGSRL